MTTRDALIEAGMKSVLKSWKAAGVECSPDLEASELAVRATIAAIEAAGVRMVPVEATQDMTGAVLGPGALRWDVMKTYAAMIAASPYAPKETGGE